MCLSRISVEATLDLQNFLEVNLNFRCRALLTCHRLVDHDSRIRQSVSFSGRSTRRAGRLPYWRPDRCSTWQRPQADVLHRVVDRQTRRDGSTWRVDVKMNVSCGIFELQVQQLSHDEIRGRFPKRQCPGSRCDPSAAGCRCPWPAPPRPESSMTMGTRLLIANASSANSRRSQRRRELSGEIFRPVSGIGFLFRLLLVLLFFLDPESHQRGRIPSPRWPSCGVSRSVSIAICSIVWPVCLAMI